MSLFETIFVLIGLPWLWLAAGYWLAALMATGESPSRPALALLAGLGSLLLSVSIINAFLPLTGLAAWACLLPAAASVGWKRSRKLMLDDLRALAGRRSNWIQVGALLPFFAAVLWPLLHDSRLAHHEGGGNHDSFFWISNADHLQSHPYMKPVTPDPRYPLTINSVAISGWKPAWGRMGAEGLLALTSAVSDTDVIRIYLPFSAALYFAWLATGWIAVRLFYGDSLSLAARGAFLLLQPIFIYFHRNANLPNLLGVIMGSAAIVTMEAALRASRERSAAPWGWSLLLALSLHGLYCAYSEMLPFVLLPCVLLGLRAWLRSGKRCPAPAFGWIAGAMAASVLINPATTFRAAWGFYAAVQSARADDRWADILTGLGPMQYLAALSTLAPPAAKLLTPGMGAGVSLVLVVGLLLAWRRARDPWGALLAFSGGLLLLLYTLVSDFTYGWQKSVQFCGIFLSMTISVAAVDALFSPHGVRSPVRHLTRLAAITLMLFLSFAVGMQVREISKWSHRKPLSRDWSTLQDLSRTTLRDKPVLIDAATFSYPFFHSMWAAYFLPDSQVYFGSRGEHSGGYLRSMVRHEGPQASPAPLAVLVSREWADSIDPESPRLYNGREFTLLEWANRVRSLTGMSPPEGLPGRAGRDFSIEIEPAVAARLLLTLSPGTNQTPAAPGAWEVLQTTPAEADALRTTISGQAPWHFNLPLTGRKRQVLHFRFRGDANFQEDFPFMVDGLRLVAAPAPLDPNDQLVDFTQAEDWRDLQPEGLTFSSPRAGILARTAGASLRFRAKPAATDVALEIVARPIFPANQETRPLLTELRFNHTLIFSGFFTEPGVLRARIFREHWNQHPVADLNLRFPDNPEDGPRLLLQTLTVRQENSPRP